ncbi:MAG: hypothetical protein P8J27_05805, partial [Mariniblastus sp.]|nr:hypothetical protein [Mariniblastus sp.]
MSENTFGQDLEFLKKHVGTIVLSNDEGAAIVVVPQYQGRTMTSTSNGAAGKSYGYINYDCISSDVHDPQINLYGGEDRMWISPEGGQFSVFFEPGAEMEYANWRTPSVLDTEPFDLVRQDAESASFTQQARLVNWSNTEFRIRMDRDVVLLNRAAAGENLEVEQSDLDGLN